MRLVCVFFINYCPYVLLSGMVAGRLGAESVVLSDGSEVVMRLIERQIEASKERESQHIPCPLIPRQLVWGVEEVVPSVITELADHDLAAPTVFIGADVVSSPPQYQTMYV